MPERRNILVTGATGKQGRSAVFWLLNPTADSTAATAGTPHPAPPPASPDNEAVPAAGNDVEYHVLALTRSPDAPHARALLTDANRDRLTLVQGDLDSPQTVRKVFEDAAAGRFGGTGIWGVYGVLAYPGLGSDGVAEEKQGRLLADLALEFGVRAYLYSSLIGMGAGAEENDTDGGGMTDQSHRAKVRIERHCRELGAKEKGLNWVFIKPGFFMENFDGLVGAVTTTVMSQGLAKDTTLALVASEDIGRVAAGVLRKQNPEPFIHQTLLITSGRVTMDEIKDEYKRAVGKSMPGIPAVLGRLLLKNKGTTAIMAQTTHSHDAVAKGWYPTFDAEVALADSVCHLQTFYEWKMKHKDEPVGDAGASGGGRGSWNQVSLIKLFTGRS